MVRKVCGGQNVSNNIAGVALKPEYVVKLAELSFWGRMMDVPTLLEGESALST